jgi:alkaline phosphatase D
MHSACAEAEQSNQTMLGGLQEQWLDTVLNSAKSTWHIIAQQVLFSPMTRRGEARDLDKWDGAVAARARLLRTFQEKADANFVVLSGDAHLGLAFDIRDNPDPGSRCLAVELMATSISSGGDGLEQPLNAPTLFADNPMLKFASSERGYSRHVVTPKAWQVDYRVVERVSTPGMPIMTRKSLIIEAGIPGLTDL